MRNLVSVLAVFMSVVCVSPASAATKVALVPFNAFTSDGTNDANSYRKRITEGGLLVGVAPGGASLVAPVPIPRSATKITKVIVYMKDNEVGGDDPIVRLTATKMDTGAQTLYLNSSVVGLTDSSSAVELLPDPRAALKGGIYSMQIWLYPNQYFHGAKVYYTVP